MNELIAELRAVLEERARDAHRMHAMFSKGGLHPGEFEVCQSMACEHVRGLLARAEDAGALK